MHTFCLPKQRRLQDDRLALVEMTVVVQPVSIQLLTNFVQECRVDKPDPGIL